MSSPIKTNTEELQNILQQVYNLPDRSSGSAEPDLVITPTEDFNINSVANNSNYNITKIQFDQTAVISTYEKLAAGKDVRVTFTGLMYLNSFSPRFMTTYTATRVIAYGTDVNSAGNWLVVRILATPTYVFLSADNGTCELEYRFLINPNTNEASLDSAVLWS